MVRTLGWSSLRVVAALLVLAVAGIVALGAADTARAQSDASVSIVDFGFNPSSITIAAGATVTWANTGNATHTVTADDGSFDSGNIASGGTYSFTFDTPGTYTYHCAIHPNMKGTIVVTAASSGNTTSSAASTSGGSTTGGSSSQTQLPTTGAGTTAPGGIPVALLALALAAALAAGGLLATRLRSPR